VAPAAPQRLDPSPDETPTLPALRPLRSKHTDAAPPVAAPPSTWRTWRKGPNWPIWHAWRRRLSGPALQLGIGLAVALILVVTFARVVNLGSVFARLAHLNVALAFLCGAVFLLAFGVRALRWRLLLAPRRVGAVRVVLIYQVAMFVNWLLPIRGGELVKSVLLRKLDDIPISESLPTVAMDKALDLLPAVGLLLLVPFMPFHLSRPLWLLLLFALVILVAGVAFLGLMAWRRRAAQAVLARLTLLLPRAVRARAEAFLAQFMDALLGLVARPRLLLVATGYTVVAVGLDALFCYLAFAAVGAHVAFPLVLYGYTFYNLGYMLPTPPGQIGSNELIGLLVFAGLFGLNSSDVAAMFLFSHPWTAILMAIAGLLSLSAMGLNLRGALALTRSPGEAKPQPEPGT
jgi:uncharacterized protein (TIRG00374 family)